MKDADNPSQQLINLLQLVLPFPAGASKMHGAPFHFLLSLITDAKLASSFLR